jgi:hypothetical protein
MRVYVWNAHRRQQQPLLVVVLEAATSRLSHVVPASSVVSSLSPLCRTLMSLSWSSPGVICTGVKIVSDVQEFVFFKSYTKAATREQC